MRGMGPVSVSESVSLSCLFITLVYCIKTAEPNRKQLEPIDSANRTLNMLRELSSSLALNADEQMKSGIEL